MNNKNDVVLMIQFIGFNENTNHLLLYNIANTKDIIVKRLSIETLIHDDFIIILWQTKSIKLVSSWKIYFS